MCCRQGACLFYDTNRFRYSIFGFSLLFQVIGTLSAAGLLWAIYGMRKQGRMEEEHSKSVIKRQGRCEEQVVLVEKVSGV